MAKATKRTPRELSLQANEETLKADLENYKQKAVELGASEAKIIPAQWVEVDERVRLKCAIPPCPNYNRCSYCPPFTPEPEFMRKVFGRYNWAILFKNDVPVEDFVDFTRYYPYGKDHQKKTCEIAAKLETFAGVGGYEYTLGFGAGGCRDTLCNGSMCYMLDSGRCPYILKARPSMEGVGIDVFGLVKKVGWKIYPCYRNIDPKLVPSAISVGLVFIH